MGSGASTKLSPTDGESSKTPSPQQTGDKSKENSKTDDKVTRNSRQFDDDSRETFAQQPTEDKRASQFDYSNDYTDERNRRGDFYGGPRPRNQHVNEYDNRYADTSYAEIPRGYQPNVRRQSEIIAYKERLAFKRDLDKIADSMTQQPPGAIQNSQSFSSGYELYKNKCSAQTHDELKRWFKQEKELLKEETIDYLLKAKYASKDDWKVIRPTQISEFELRLGALINVYQERSDYFEAERLQIEQEKNEDSLFFKTMLERVQDGHLPRKDVITHIDDYSAECRKKLTRSSGNNINRLVNGPQNLGGPGPTGVYRTRTPGAASNPYQHKYQQPLNQAEQEAKNIMASAEQNARRVRELRRQEREAIHYSLDSRMSSVLPPVG